MRGYIILSLVGLAVVGAFDAYKYDGRHSRAAWAQTNGSVRYMVHEMQPMVHRAMSGRLLTGQW